jgi:hypothetical protein
MVVLADEWSPLMVQALPARNLSRAKGDENMSDETTFELPQESGVSKRMRERHDMYPEKYSDEDATIASVMLLAEVLDERLGRIEQELKTMNTRLQHLALRGSCD